MNDLTKVSGLQIYLMLKSVTISLLMPILVLSLSYIFPDYFSPIFSMVIVGVLYSLIITNQRRGERNNCMLIKFAMLMGIALFTFVTVMSNVLAAWNIIIIPGEVYFFQKPYIPSLVLMPCLFVSYLFFTIARRRTKFCTKCRLHNGNTLERGKTGVVISNASKTAMRNLTWLFGFISVLIWLYYLEIYVNINQNSRDWYVFLWLVVIFLVLDELFFIFRFYNIYLDLQENNELLTIEDLQDMHTKTYLRLYVICDNKIYLFDRNATSRDDAYMRLLDSPFVYIYEQSQIGESYVRSKIKDATGVGDGELKFFYRVSTPDISNHYYQRYFYFLNGKPEDYPQLRTEGKWIDFEQLKRIYSTNPEKLGRQMLSDLTRLSTIIITEKIFDEQGNRKLALKNYTPSYNLIDVRRSNLDFQDNKWLKISNYNEDNRSFRVKRFFRRLFGRTNLNRIWL